MVTQCMPLSKMWDFTGTVSGTCINSTAMFYSTFIPDLPSKSYELLSHEQRY